MGDAYVGPTGGCRVVSYRACRGVAEPQGSFSWSVCTGVAGLYWNLSGGNAVKAVTSSFLPTTNDSHKEVSALVCSLGFLDDVVLTLTGSSSLSYLLSQRRLDTLTMSTSRTSVSTDFSFESGHSAGRA